MSDYLDRALSPTPQSEPLSSEQVKNNAGGYVYKIGPFSRLQRFLILGSEGNTYYQKEQELTIKNAKNLNECIQQDGENNSKTVDLITTIWNENRAPKPNVIMFSLAVVAAKGGQANRDLLKERFNGTVRTGYHLFRFVHYATKIRGWGRYLKNLVKSWYLSKTPQDLEYQALKYQQREGWGHRDLLRLTHPKSKNLDSVFKSIVGKEKLGLFATVASIKTTKDAITAIRQGVSHEMIPTNLKDKSVWQALLDKGMPITALVRNLGVMTANGAIKPLAADVVVQSLLNKEKIQKSRIHPIQILSALATYKSGHGARGKLKWNSIAEVADALDTAFESSFKNVQPANKRFLLALDVSGSMTWGNIAGVPGVDPRTGAAAMSMITCRTEPSTIITAFSRSMIPIGSITRKSTLANVLDAVSNLPFGGTDCAQPILYAMKNDLDVDVFVIYTDNETWAGKIHPKAALDEYRRKKNPNAKLIVVGMTSTGFSIAKPNDPGMLDIVGFDAAAPVIMKEFATN